MMLPLSTTTRGTAAATKTRKALLPDPHTPCDLPLLCCSKSRRFSGTSQFVVSTTPPNTFGEVHSTQRLTGGGENIADVVIANRVCRESGAGTGVRPESWRHGASGTRGGAGCHPGSGCQSERGEVHGIEDHDSIRRGLLRDGCRCELELIQTQMTQKPMLRAEVYARALRASQNRKEDSV